MMPVHSAWPAFEVMLATWSLLAVEGHRVEARIGQPERGLEAGLERRRGDVEPLGEAEVAAMAGEPRHRPVRGEDVALDLGQRDRAHRRPAVEVADRIARILPALVEQPELRAALVFDEAVAIEVARSSRSSRARPARSATADRAGASSPVQAWVSASRISHSGVESMLP